jgi:hypothetical protein
MTLRAHLHHKVKRLKARTALAFMLLFSLTVWMLVGWLIWYSLIKFTP